MAKWITKIWHEVKTEDVYKPYRGGAFAGMLFREALWDTSPGVQFMTNLISG